MKKVNFKNLLLLICVGILSACASPKNSSYESLIPADKEDAVIAINLQNLITKSDLRNQLTESDWSKIYSGIGNLSIEKKSSELLTQIMKEPENSGLDITNNIYYVIEMDEETTRPTSLLLASAVKDMGKVKKMIEVFDDLKPQADINNFKHYADANKVHLLLDKNICLVFQDITTEQIQARLESASNLDKQVYFEKLKNNNDLALSINAQIFGEGYANTLIEDFGAIASTPNEFIKSFYDKFEGALYQIVSLNFENGRIALKQELQLEKESDQAVLDELTKAYQPIQNSYADYLDKDPLLYLNFGLNGEKSYELIKPLLTDQKIFNLQGDNLAFAEMIFKAAKGDLAFVLSDLNISMFQPDIKLGLFCPISDEAIYQKIVALVKSDYTLKSKIKSETAQYIEFYDSSQHIYFGRAESFIYLTTDKRFTENPIKKVESSIVNTRYFNNSKNTPGYFSIDLQKLFKNPMLQMWMASVMQAEPVKNLIDNLDYIDAKYNNTTSEAQIVIKKTDENTLKILTIALLELSRM